jgi:hypothetical protein
MCSNIDELEEALVAYPNKDVLDGNHSMPELARMWDGYEFDAVAAKQWWDVECYDALSAAELVDAGIDPRDVASPAPSPNPDRTWAWAYAEAWVSLERVVDFVRNGAGWGSLVASLRRV